MFTCYTEMMYAYKYTILWKRRQNSVNGIIMLLSLHTTIVKYHV